MGNFEFIKAEWPAIQADCANAERYLSSDPRSACFYARRAVEQLVDHVYDVARLRQPYRDDLAARIAEPSFRNLVGAGIAQKLTLIRMLGNRAVHEQRPIPPRAAVDALRELFHVVVWTAHRYSTNPTAVPTSKQFDPALARAAAPLSRDEVVRLAERFRKQDEEYQRQLAERDDLAAAKDAEIDRLRAEIAAVQAAQKPVDDHDYAEAETRDRFIDVLLAEAGWSLTDERDREYPVSGMPTTDGRGYVDYVLWGADGLPLAVVEAKRTKKDPQVGQQQARLYADCLQQMTGRRPVIFYTNGYEHWLWDDAAGYPPREVQGFYTRDELELLVQRRTTRKPLADAAIDAGIVERHYQRRAIRAIDDTFAQKQREALLVMATGSGKTRTVIALVDQLMKAGWVKRVLFLADRTALVNQAVTAFKQHLPSATTVNLVTEKISDGRVYVSTYPTMLNLVNGTQDGLRTFGPGYFDLVVIDEAHRSVYQKYRAIFDWFDSLLVGLTATPKDEVDHNTYRLFHLEDGVPTDAYSLDDAVAEGYLVPPVGVSVPLKFMREGIRYDALSDEEKDEWDSLEWSEDGDVPESVSAEELNRFLFNEDTVDKVLATLMSEGHKVAGGDTLGKTIVFAKNREHALFVERRFNEQYPEYGGTFARVITHGVPYVQSLIDDFSTTDKPPQIAISVDMLDTGIDVPDVCNLVFFKLVRSKSKFWQMLGRGTRLRPDLFGPDRDKRNFYVFDFCQNLEFFSQDLPSSEGSLQKSLWQRIVEARLGLVAALDADETEPGLREETARGLQEFVAGMNLDNILVRPERRLVERYADWAAWESLTHDQAGDLAVHLAGLPSSARDDDEDAKRFDLLVLHRQLAQLEGDAITAERLRGQVQHIASGLLAQTSIPTVAEQQHLLDEVAGDEWWVDVTLPMLELARKRLRGLVRFLPKGERRTVYTDFEDELGGSTIVELPGTTPGTDWERFRAKARAYLAEHEDHLALQRLRRNQPLTRSDLDQLEEMLLASGAGRADDIARAKEESQGLGLFVRSLVGLDRGAATDALSRFLDDTTYSRAQIDFVGLIVSELTANGVMAARRLYESPFTDNAPSGPDYYFSDADVDGIIVVLDQVRANASPDYTVA